MNPPPSLKQLVTDRRAPDSATVLVSLAAVAPARRKKLWDLEDKHHCPIVGTCVPMIELVRFARRFDFKGSLTDEFALHVEAVQWSMSRNEVAEALHKHLERKYEGDVKRFERAKTDADVRALWKEQLARGEVAGPLWAACTHKAASAETRHIVYADIHMLSHQVGAGQAADSRRLTQLEQESARVKGALEQERQERVIAETVFRERIRQLEEQIATGRAESAEFKEIRERLAAFESGTAMVEMGRRLMGLELANEQMRSAAQRSRELEGALKALREELAGVAGERDLLATERDALERVLLTSESGVGTDTQPCAVCDQVAEERCILCVGGRTALVSQYRALAERLGIRLVHHDGGQEEALSRLPDMINGADAVICPTDCVSHAAYYQLKRHCKRSGKPCLLFKGSGVSSFAVALAQLSSGRVSLAADLPGHPS